MNHLLIGVEMNKEELIVELARLNKLIEAKEYERCEKEYELHELKYIRKKVEMSIPEEGEPPFIVVDLSSKEDMETLFEYLMSMKKQEEETTRKR